ncbi:hypothetical protein [Caulobacter soli]|uniref:hypothetical protein n=1 Tax=Caulobacter soli TaxID=2708539 RepID=UPI0013EBB954|nr:hypothetical protein [Caulobacter soli]
MPLNLKVVVLAACIAVAPLSVAHAGSLSTQKTTVGDLFANPQAKAIVEKQFPGISSDLRMVMAKGKTFRELNAMNPKGIPADKLDAIDAELAKLP